MRRNSGRCQRKESHSRHLVSGAGPPHMSTLRHRHQPLDVRREDHVGEWTCSCASHGRRVPKFPPKRLNNFSGDTWWMNRDALTENEPEKDGTCLLSGTPASQSIDVVITQRLSMRVVLCVLAAGLAPSRNRSAKPAQQVQHASSCRCA